MKNKKTIILSIVLNECETKSTTIKEEYKMRMFENRMYRRIHMALRGRKWQEDGEKYLIRNSVVSKPTLAQILLA
jgi:hypothetical protein